MFQFNAHACIPTIAVLLSAAGPAPPSSGTAVPTAVPYAWRHVVIGGGGYVTGLVADLHGTTYARTDVGGAYKRGVTDDGWRPFGPKLSDARWNEYGIDAIAVHPLRPGTAVLTCGKRARSEPQGMPEAGTMALARTRDGGRTWTTSAVPFSVEANGAARWGGERLVFLPHNGRRSETLFYASRYDGLWRSEDVGVSWKHVKGLMAKGVYGRGMLFVAAAGRSVAVGVAGTGVFRSDDGGMTWRQLEGGPTADPMRGAFVGDDLVATECSPTSGVFTGSAWRHDGARWKRLVTSDSGGFVAVAVDDHAPAHLIVGEYGWGSMRLLETRDGGQRWSAMPAANADRSRLPWNMHPFAQGVSQVVIDSDDVWLADGFGVWRKRGLAEPWQAAGNGIEETVVWDLKVAPEGPLLSALGDVDGFRHEDLDHAPQRHFDEPPLQHATSVDTDRTGNVVVRVGESWRRDIVAGGISRDGGRTWRAFATAPTDEQGGRIAVSADGRTIVWVPKGHLPHVTTDGGGTWRRSAGVTSPAIMDFWQRDQPLAADSVNPRRFYLWAGGALLVSDDGALSFRAAGRLPHAPADAAVSVRAQPGAEGSVWVALGPAGLHKSADGGATFTRVDDIEPRLIAFGRARAPEQPATVFVLGRLRGSVGMFRGDAAAARGWVRLGGEATGLTNDPRALAADPHVYGRVYVGTFGSGIIYGDEERAP